MSTDSQLLKKYLRLSTALVAGTLFCAPTGCQNFNLRGEGFNDSFAESAGYKRAKEPTAAGSAFSTRAQQIEADLGVR